ncbi:MAG: DsbA family protein [Anaerolineales bacterium]
MSKRSEMRRKRMRERRLRRLVVIFIFLGAALLITATIIWPNIAPIGDIVIPRTKSYSLADGNAMGEPNAPVVIEEFSDFQCSYCRTFHQSTGAQIIEQYVETGQVRLIFRNYAFLGLESLAAANGSMCAAEQGKFWEYADILFANQSGHDAGAFSDRRLEAFAENINLDTALFQSCMRENRYQDQIQQDYQAGVSYGINSTPSFIINGKLVVGALPLSDFQSEIEAALMESEASSP